MKWTCKALGPDLDEPKLNTRADNPDNLFEIAQRFMVEVEKESHSCFAKGESIFAVTTGGTEDPIGIAIGSELLILNKSREGIERTIEFKASIDVIVWRRSVFIVGLSNSEIILLCPHTFLQNVSRRVSPDPKFTSEQFFVDAYIHSNPDPTKIDLFALGINGVVYSFRDVSLLEGSMDHTQDENMTFDIDVSTIKGSYRRYLNDDAHVTCACSPARNFIISGEANGNITVFQLWDELEPTDIFRRKHLFLSVNLRELLGFPDEVQPKKIVHCEGLLFVLFTNGHLEILLDDQLISTGGIKLQKHNQLIQDFTLVIYSMQTVKLWAIFSSPDEEECCIGIFAGPSFTAEFIAKIPIPSETMAGNSAMYTFPRQINPLEEPTAVLAIEKNGNSTLYQMSESSTDISLQNLLVKSRFDKAELLAKKYGKDLDLVWKAKVRATFNEVISGKSDKSVEKSFAELVSTLQLVKDAEFVCTFCFSRRNGIPRLEWVKELLAIGLKRVSECSSSDAGQILLLTGKKLYTFNQVLPEGGIAQWNQFNDEHNTMFDQCLRFLELNEFSKCQIVWLRHSDEFIPRVDLQHFAVFFKVLFEKCLGTHEAVCLFKTIFPFAVEKCESEYEVDGNKDKINAFMALIRSQIRSLEREFDWPKDAITFTECLINIIQEEFVCLEDEKTMSDEPRIEKKLRICSEIIARLKKLHQALLELSNLKSGHSIRIPFEKYITENNFEVVNSMLKLIFAKEEVGRFVNKFLRPFAKRNKLNMDALFESHIQSAAEDVQYFINSVGIPFEERLVALIEFIDSPKVKLSCVYRMTEEWPVPWLPPMKRVVSQCLELNAADTECVDLQKNIRLMEIQVPYRVLLHKYRLTASKLSKGFGVYMALERIMKWKKENCWDDCLELIKHTGKFTPDSVFVLKFWLDLSASTFLGLDDIIPQNCKVDMKLRFLRRVLHKFRIAQNQSEEPQEMWLRFTECARTLANQTDEDKTAEFLKLREIVPELWDDNIVSSMNYPFSALTELLLSRVNGLTSVQIIAECDKLSVLSFSNASDILVTTAAFLCGPGNLGSAFQKIWDIVTRIVETPNGFSGDKENTIVPSAGLEVAHHLIMFAPTTSCELMNILLKFCILLEHSYDEIAEPVARLQTVIWIFQGLRDSEIPLEQEFLDIYKTIWREGLRDNEELQIKLKSMGEIILRFGNTDILRQVFNAVFHELKHGSLNLFGEMQVMVDSAASSILVLKDSLLSEAQGFEPPEANVRVTNLVKFLNAAGLPMNSYALRQRSKERLIKKLLEMSLFNLAAQVALVFDFRGQPSWSSILEEYMAKATVPELKTILESLKRMSDLWVLPQFTQAWLKVSEKHPSFKHMCPIPLNF